MEQAEISEMRGGYRLRAQLIVATPKMPHHYPDLFDTTNVRPSRSTTFTDIPVVSVPVSSGARIARHVSPRTETWPCEIESKPDIMVAFSDARSESRCFSPGPILTLVGAIASIEAAIHKSARNVETTPTTTSAMTPQSVKLLVSRIVVPPTVTEVGRMTSHQVNE